MLKELQKFVNEMKDTSSLNKKKVIIDSIKDNKFITKALNYALDPYKKYYLTSKNCKKNSDICDMNSIYDDVSKNTDLIHGRLDVLIENCRKIGLEFVIPDGAMYVFAKIMNNKINTTELAHKLLEHGLAIAPGEAFGDYGEFFRISACIKKESIIEGLNILSSEINK